MTRRPKDIGTAFTTDTIRYLHGEGWTGAELRNQAGDHDKGDIINVPRVVIECKGGEEAETAYDKLVADWLEETEAERLNAGADIGLLVMKRAGYGAKRASEWWCVMTGMTLCQLTGEKPSKMGPGQAEHWLDYLKAPVRMHLRTAVALLKAAGYGPR